MPMLFSYDDDDDDSCKNSQTLPRKLCCQYDIYIAIMIPTNDLHFFFFNFFYLK